MVIGRCSGRILSAAKPSASDPNHSGEFSTPIQPLKGRAGADRDVVTVLSAVRHIDVVGGDNASDWNVLLAGPAHANKDLDLWLKMNVRVGHHALCRMGARACLSHNDKPVLTDVMEQPALVDGAISSQDGCKGR
jgi:hypothetical protein